MTPSRPLAPIKPPKLDVFIERKLCIRNLLVLHMGLENFLVPVGYANLRPTDGGRDMSHTTAILPFSFSFLPMDLQ